MAIMNKMKFNQLCLIALTIAVCIQRLSIAAGNILYALSILFFIIDTYRRYQSGEKLFLTEQVKKYFLVYVFFALTILPSAIFSLDMGYSSSKFLDYFVLRFLVFFMLIFFENRYRSYQEGIALLYRFHGYRWYCDAC